MVGRSFGGHVVLSFLNIFHFTERLISNSIILAMNYFIFMENEPGI